MVKIVAGLDYLIGFSGKPVIYHVISSKQINQHIQMFHKELTSVIFINSSVAYS